MAWSVTEYIQALKEKGPKCTGRNEKIEKELEKMFPPGDSQFEDQPCVIADWDGIVLVWYLPGLLSRERRVRC